MRIADAVQRSLAAGSLLVAGWWALLALSALRRPGALRRGHGGMTFAVIVPAHNEELMVARTVQSLRVTGFQPQPDILVVADNCTDSTAEVAIAAGATVLVRDNPTLRGKSYALDFALEQLRRRANPPDAVVVVDADTSVSPSFFQALADRFGRGSAIVQVHYAAAKGDSSTGRLRALAFSLVHWARPLGASRLGLPTSLKGNGMAFRWELVRYGLPGAGLTEDAAATVAFARRGVAVDFEPRATVTGYMASTYAQARTQDLRWEGGRMALTPAAVRAAMAAAMRGDLRSAAGAAEAASPPLTLVLAGAAAGLALGVAGFGSLRLALLATAALGAYVIAGLAAARAPLRDVLALAAAPRFIVHKFTVYVQLAARRGPSGWDRTERDTGDGPGTAPFAGGVDRSAA